MKTGMNEKESKVLTKRPDTIPCTNKNNTLTHTHTKNIERKLGKASSYNLATLLHSHRMLSCTAGS